VRGADALSGTVWLAVGAFIIYGAWRLDIGTLQQPGSGLVPLACGLAMSALALGIIVGDLMGASDRQSLRALWQHVPVGRLALVVMTLTAYAMLFVPVGFQLSTAALMIALFKILGLRRWTVAVGAATATVVMAWVVFRLWLQVQLPAGILALG
jgi:putative tricarboxylic transport membrane protein